MFLPRPRSRRTCVTCILLLLAAACVRVEERRQPIAKTALMIGREQSGVTLQWKSEKGQRYTILYKDPRNSKSTWQPLPQATEVVGTGETIYIHDNAPGAFYRNYMPQALVRLPANASQPR